MRRIMFVSVMNAEPIRYCYRARPMGAETILTLLPGHIRAERGVQNFTVDYKDIVAIWLSYKPRGSFFTGFRTKIYARNGKTITLDDTTFASFFSQKRQAEDYRAFDLELIDRVKAANPQAQIMGGRNFWAQSLTILIGIGFGIALPMMGIRSFQAGQTSLGLIFIAFALAFIGWSWGYIRRNRLRNLRDGVPDDLLPGNDPLSD